MRKCLPIYDFILNERFNAILTFAQWKTKVLRIGIFHV